MVPDYEEIEAAFDRLGNVGHTIAINISSTTPEFYHTTLNEDWVEEYIAKTYAFLDPVMQFAAFSSGVMRWSEIRYVKIPVVSNVVFERAKSFGLNYGLAIVRKGKNGSKKKHLLSIARSDRELTDDEVVEATSLFEQLLSNIAPDDHLTQRQLTMLTLFARGKTREEVANELRLSVPTIRNEVSAVKEMWNAANIVEIVGIACARKLIVPHEKIGK